MQSRSLQQNKYYWKVPIAALRDKAKAEGNPISKEMAHRLAMLAVGHCEYQTRWGVTTLEPKPTHDLSVQQYEEILERVRAWAARYLRVEIMLPNEGITYPAFTEERPHL